jgi:pimeloyl-ACP methyl ester carboxylesterase
LARTAADFEPLAEALSIGPKPRFVIAVDYRGRGQSEYDPDTSKYNIQVELADVLTVLTRLKATPAIVVGTSRGGILAMLLGAIQPDALAGVVLNDIGPVIEHKGLMRIKGYVGKLPQPQNFEDAAVILRQLFSAQFPRLTDEDWLASAHRTFKTEHGRLVPTYDVRLAETLSSVAPDKASPELWAQFDSLSRIPLLVIRGALSDILSTKTVAAMRARRTSIELVEVPDEGHAPLLADKATIDRIVTFVSSISRAGG